MILRLQSRTLFLQKNERQSCERDDQHHLEERVLHLLVHFSAPHLVVGEGYDEFFSASLQESTDKRLDKQFWIRRVMQHYAVHQSEFVEVRFGGDHGAVFCGQILVQGGNELCFVHGCCDGS